MREASNWSLNFGVYAGVPVRLHASFLVGAVTLIYFASRATDKDLWALGLLAVLLWLVSLFVHQTAHLLAAARLGGQIDRIVIGPLGDLAPITAVHDPRHEVLVHMAGPLGTLVLLLLSAMPLVILGEDFRDVLFSPFGPVNIVAGSFWIIIFKLSVWINWLLLLANLLPAITFDVGRALIAAFRPALGEPGATLKVALVGALVTSLILCICSGMSNTGDTRPLVPAWFPLTLLVLYVFFATRHEFLKLTEEDREGDLVGYDFSQGYTSLEASEPARRREPGFIRRWLEQRREEKRRRMREIEADEERRVDEILARVKDGGMQALSPEERALLNRVSARYRNRQSNA